MELSLYQKQSLVVLRVALGWLYFYAGYTKLSDPAWSAAGYIKSAKVFPGLYQMFLNPFVLPIINFLNEWGLTLLGLSLIFGIFVRMSGKLGIILMLLYYFVLPFPHPDANSYIVDQHIIYSAVLLVLVTERAGRMWGCDKWLSRFSWASRHLS